MEKLRPSVVLADLFRHGFAPHLLVAFVLLIVVPYCGYLGFSKYALDSIDAATRSDPHPLGVVQITVLGFTGTVSSESTLSISLPSRYESPLARLLNGDVKPHDLNGDPDVVTAVLGMIGCVIVYQLGYFCFLALATVWLYGTLTGELWRFADIWKLSITHNMWPILGYSVAADLAFVALGALFHPVLAPLMRATSGLTLLLLLTVIVAPLLLRFALWSQAMIVEEASLLGSLRRSFELTRGNVWRMSGISLLAILAPLVLSSSWILNPLAILRIDPKELISSLSLSVIFPDRVSPIILALQVIGELLLTLIVVTLSSIFYAQLRQLETQAEPSDMLSDADRVSLEKFASRQEFGQ